jgi:hypothetical protein
MTEEMKKAVEQDQETIKPAGAKKDDLSEKELEKAVGGWNGGVGDAFQQG